MLEIALVLAVVLVAFANGANDNFKGVATLYGSGTTSYRGAIAWATVTTLAGSMTAVLLSVKLVAAFSGKGLVPDALTRDPRFVLAAGVGAGATVLIASRVGLPISTTHSLLGALLGAGLLATSGHVQFARLGRAFILPLGLSPLLAMALTSVLYRILRLARHGLGVERRMCVCIKEGVEPVSLAPDGTAVLRSTGIALTVQQQQACREQYWGTVIGFDAQAILDRLHYLSAGLVGFARGMNDAPKIVALLVAAKVLGIGAGLALVAVVMAVGGLLAARRVAETLSHRITAMNHGQAFTANAVTAALVLIASRWGLPVSTTHVSVGSLAGIGAATGQGRWATISTIAAAWITTLPLAATLGAASYALARWTG